MKLEWVPDAVAPHIKRLSAALGARIDTVMKEAREEIDRSIDRAIAALAPPTTEPIPDAVFDEDEHADSDRRDHDPLPDVRGGAGRGLPAEEPDRRDSDSDAGRPNASNPGASPPTNQGREEGQRTARLVIPDDIIEKQLGPDIAKMLAPGKPIAPAPLRLRPKKEALDAAQARIAARRNGPEPLPVVVSPSASEQATAAYTLAAAKARIADLAGARKQQRRARFAARTKPADPNPNAEERWSKQRIDEETELAEGRKPDIFELPVPSLSWEIR